MKVADSSGNIIEGLNRSPNNGLVVNNPTAYQKYLVEKQRIERLHSLEKEMSEMKTTLSQILEILKENKQ
jgi:hypothetical protein